MDTLDILRKLRCVLVWGLRQCNVLTRFWHWVSRAIYSLFIYIYIFLNISLVSCSHTHTRTHSHTRRQTDWYYRSISFTVISEHNTLRKHVNGAFSYFFFFIWVFLRWRKSEMEIKANTNTTNGFLMRYSIPTKIGKSKRSLRGQK